MSETATATAKPKYWLGVPRCDFCPPSVQLGSVFYDAATTSGPWANMCHAHYKQYGRKLGQKYKREKGSDRWVKVCDLQVNP